MILKVPEPPPPTSLLPPPPQEASDARKNVASNFIDAFLIAISMVLAPFLVLICENQKIILATTVAVLSLKACPDTTYD
jgi:hypothetical protein